MERGNKKEVSRLLKGRKIIEIHRKEHNNLNTKVSNFEEVHELLTQKLFKSLKNIGFESVDEFEKFNKDICFKEFRRCYKRISDCDGCEDRKRGCVKSCFDNY